MKAVIQRVKRACVYIKKDPRAKIKEGFLVLVGIGQKDGSSQAKSMAEQISQLRIMEDGEGKMNLSLLETDGEVLVVPQFTLHADTSKGRRPSFNKAAQPEKAQRVYENFVEELERTGLNVETGEFGAYMEVELVNSGPVTLVLEEE